MSIPIPDDESLFNNVKYLQGTDYLTIEGTEDLTDRQLQRLIQLLADHPEFRKIPTITILVEGTISEHMENILRSRSFHLHDEVVFYQRRLEDLINVQSAWTIRSLHELNQKDFLKVWEKVISGSLNASSILSMEKQMDSVKAELGSRYKDSCLVAFEEKKPIGILMPHIEPGTELEGRLFYFGLVPDERNKRQSRGLHLHALARLKHDFHAAVYVGSTSINNLPMRKVFEQNGCQWLGKKLVYKRTAT
ncbi:hypothetical protein ERJ70_05495 [Sediminibacillus dalangtanensis]|uniref:N-acetyltransferase domain-containing protein n=1 Tax=Sediminibacillus dalangtanensis TaxID=2729421 RepID=A0ABX7VQL8_9BACI|nr:GNAT family N-acetyltransferase [Sediminibacillus dalangtanensis]QTM98798.1 hypothetical protein ERJ70_05495 [Sediminibacillus dalangtanensis]